jgi:gas vesicle protein
MDLFSNISPITQFLLVLGGFVTAGSTVFFYWTKSAKVNRQEENVSEERIRELLKEENSLLNKKIDDLTETTKLQSVQIEALKKTQEELQSQNELLTRIFQGRDEDAVDYRKSGRDAMKRIQELEPLIRETNGNCKDVLKSIAKLYEAIEKHLKVIENTTTTVQEKTTTTAHKTRK